MATIKDCVSVAAQEDAQITRDNLLKLRSLERARLVQSQLLESFHLDIFVLNSLVDLYAKCGSMEESSRFFHGMACHSLVSWNALLLGYAENGDEQLCLEIFSSVSERLGVESLNGRTFVASFKACSGLAVKETGQVVSNRELVKLGALAKGMELHSKAVSCGCIDIFVANSLIDMYGTCGSTLDAAKVFDKMPERDVISWTALVSAFAVNGQVEIGLLLLSKMVESGCKLDVGALVTGLKTCMSLASEEAGVDVNGNLVKVVSLEKAMDLDSEALKQGSEAHVVVSNTLVDLYAKCGSLLDSRGVFDRMKLHTPISWTSLLAGYVENGESQLSLDLFSEFLRDFQPDAQAFTAALKACGNLANIEKLAFFHARICRCGLESEPLLANSLVDVYGRCGSIASAHHLFDCMAMTDSATWNGLIAGHSRQGKSKAVLELFHAMQEQGLKVDEISFTCVLTACSHQGLVELGKRYFDAMLDRAKHGACTIRVEHYDCMVDLLGRGNQLEAAVELARSMPMGASAVTWTSVLAASQKWRNLAVARIAFEALERLNAKDSAAYMLMANVLNSTTKVKSILHCTRKSFQVSM
ncbi:pentatricopeptide repeat-containing protein At4g39530-like [Selaginella moellendorffii]|uniref:pentatricopeptide repeat-containing protein At4g39530-like n=1 Tax=Selaginella moellendorffii TaxID=88036 RepID=UPI000D1CF33E|nr:pentatricopeptide repeat-containing protein At4g39530-like [Selaginella moellendorffii]|eukprot:XP_024517774.1 pentatricopeptide repeat-containing protein At4g39530-like [Selaginella moellendorffii]